MVSWYLKSSQVPQCRHVSVNQPAITSACKQSAVTKPATLQGKQLEMSGVNIQTQKNSCAWGFLALLARFLQEVGLTLKEA